MTDAPNKFHVEAKSASGIRPFAADDAILRAPPHNIGEPSARCQKIAPAEFAEKTVAYAEAKVAYFRALRDEMPELLNIASGKEPRPLQLDRFAERSRLLEKNRKRRQTKRHWYC